jgi:hypothetical protein
MSLDNLYEQYEIRKDAPRNVKILCLELRRLQEERESWNNKLRAIDWFKDRDPTLASREIWLRMNFIDRRINELRQCLFLAWQNKEPTGLVEDIERDILGVRAPPQRPIPQTDTIPQL